MKKTLAVFSATTMLILLPFAVMAQTGGESEAAPLEALNQKLDVDIAEVGALSSRLENAPERDREALMFRRDERSFALVRDLDELARGAALLPEDDPLRQTITTRLQDEFARVPDLILDRASELSQRIETFKTEREALSGTSRLAMEAYIYSLEDMRIKAYQAAGNLVEGRAALGLPVDDITQKLAPRLVLHAETLVGRLKFSGAAGDGLGARLALDPQNTELDAAVKEFANMHAQDMQRLEAISNLLGSIGQDNNIYKTVLLQQGQTLSVRDLDRAVLTDVLREGWSNVRTSLTEKAPDILFNLVIFILVILVFRVLSRLTRRGVIAACERSGVEMSTLLKDVLASVSSGTVMVIGILMALSQIGISLGPMLAGLGVAGFIVGFALQDTLGNFAAGGMILIYRPYDVDDFVEVVGASGLVKKMSLVSTTITTFDNQTLVVPNSKIWGDVIKNVTAQKIRRVDLVFGIGYGDDIELAERVLADIINSHELVLNKPEPNIRLHTLADSSVNFIVRPWVKTGDYWNVYWDITREVKMRFDREGISIPFPQRDVHLYQEQPS